MSSTYLSISRWNFASDAGEIALQNCHPFVRELWGRYWVFAHNGDLQDFHPRLHANFRPVGSTDSERAFCWLMQEMWKSHADVPSVEELTLTLRELAPRIARHGRFNFLLSNGDALWAHCSTNLWYVERQHPFAHAQLADEDLSIDFAQHTSRDDKVAVVVTAPLTVNESWTQFQPGELKVFVDGQADWGCGPAVLGGWGSPCGRRERRHPRRSCGRDRLHPRGRRRTSPARRSRSAA